MTLTPYTQDFEKALLWHILKHVENGLYVDVSATGPVAHSVTGFFQDQGWQGIHITPDQDSSRSYQVSLLQGKDLPVTDTSHDKTLAFKLLTKQSAPEGIIATANPQADPGINWHQCIPQGKKAHLLKINAEDITRPVLQDNNWSAVRPYIVVIEQAPPLSGMGTHQSWEHILLGANYRFIWANGLNLYYVAVERQEFFPDFKYALDFFDDVILAQKQDRDIQARETEACIRKAESRAHEAETRANRAETQLRGILQSYSWLLTTPLRIYNPKRLILATLRKTGREILRHPHLVETIKPHLKAHPWLWERLKHEVLFNNTLASKIRCKLWERFTHRMFLNDGIQQETDPEFIQITLDNLGIYFANGPLEDQRGIGRVSRELLVQLKKLADHSMPPANNAPPAVASKIYFYSSIHWCPDTLPMPCIVMIHDVIPLLFPMEFPDAIRNAWENRYKAIAAQATRIVTISQSSADDISRLLGIPDNKISVIYNGITDLPIATTVQPTLPDKPYLVFLGSHDHHKNVNVVLQALHILRDEDIHLVMIGDNKKCMAQVKEMNLEHRVHFSGRLNDQDTGYIIKHALALVFPSLYEGFGLPPMEAALLGTPTICSRRPAMTELLEGRAIFVEPDVPGEWADAILNLKLDPKLRETILSRAIDHVRGFTWQASAMRLHDILHDEAR